MDAVAQELHRLIDKIAQRHTGILVAGRDDLDHCDDAAKVMADYDAIRAPGVDLLIRVLDHLRDRRVQRSDAAGRQVQPAPPRADFNG